MKGIPGRATSLAVFFCLIGFPVRGDWRFNAETGAFYDSNLSQSDRAADVQQDGAWKSALSATNGLQLSRDLRLEISGDLEGQVWTKYDGFDSITGGLSTGLRYRFGFGPSAPWILAQDRLAYSGFDESQRNGWQENVRVSGGLKVIDRISLEARYDYDHFAASGRFFDVAGHTGSIRVTMDVTQALQVALGYAYRDGDVISYAQPPRPDLGAIALIEKPVLTFDGPYIGYRLEGSSHIFSAWASYALTRSVSCQVGYEFVNTWHSPLQYTSHLAQAKIAFAY
jgi:hypothetical protein